MHVSCGHKTAVGHQLFGGLGTSCFLLGGLARTAGRLLRRGTLGSTGVCGVWRMLLCGLCTGCLDNWAQAAWWFLVSTSCMGGGCKLLGGLGGHDFLVWGEIGVSLIYIAQK